MAVANANAIKAGEAFVNIGVRQTDLEKGLAAAKKKLHSWGNGLMSIGGVIAGAGGGLLGGLVAPLKMFSEMGSEISHASAQLGMSVENLSLLKEVGEEAGVSFEDLEKAIGKFQAGLNGTEAGKALQELGVDLSSLDGKGTTQQLEMVIDSLAKMEDQAAAMKAARELFGRGGGRLLQLARQAGGLRGAMGEANAAGLGITKEDGERAEEFERTLTRLGNSAKMAAFQIGSALAEELLKYKDAALEGVRVALSWVKEHKQLALIVAGVAVGLVVAGGALIAFGAALSALGTTIGVLTTVGGFLLSWPGLAVAAGAALVVLWARTDEGRGVVSRLAADWKDAWGGILAAIQGGDLEGAFRLAFAAIKVSWYELLGSLQKSFRDGMKRLLPAGVGGDDPLSRMLVEVNASGMVIDRWFAHQRRMLEGMSEADSRKILLKDAQEIERQAKDTHAELSRMGKEGYDDADLRNARKELQDKIAAQRNRPERIGMPGAGGGKLDPDLAKAGIAAAADAAKGQFSSYAVSQSLGLADKFTQKIASATEQTAENTKKIFEEFEKLKGVAFD